MYNHISCSVVTVSAVDNSILACLRFLTCKLHDLQSNISSEDETLSKVRSNYHTAIGALPRHAEHDEKIADMHATAEEELPQKQIYLQIQHQV